MIVIFCAERPHKSVVQRIASQVVNARVTSIRRFNLCSIEAVGLERLDGNKDGFTQRRAIGDEASHCLPTQEQVGNLESSVSKVVCSHVIGAFGTLLKQSCPFGTLP